MLDITIFTKNDSIDIETSEEMYEYLAKAGLGSVGQYLPVPMRIDGDTFIEDVCPLDSVTRPKIVEILKGCNLEDSEEYVNFVAGLVESKDSMFISYN